MRPVKELKQYVIADVEARRDALVQMADAIHANPEVAFEEFEATALLVGVLEDNGFEIERGVADLETAFVASLSGEESGPTMAFVAQYDALPGLGHACGHNLIAAAATGAGLAMKSVLPELKGIVQVVGTPAEEAGGGKVLMVDAGIFDGVDAAIMVHPSDRNALGRGSLAVYSIQIEFFGKPAHAAARPELGINALEAMLLTFSGINALRQHLRDDARIHGVITHGGDAANIVPEYTSAEMLVRAVDTPYAREIYEKVRACAEGAALATGARLAFTQPSPRYDARMPNPKLVDLYHQNMLALGQEVELATGNESKASSDMGNVSQVVPSIIPGICIGPLGLGMHTVECREASASPLGPEAMILAAKALAMTAVDLLAEPANLNAAREAYLAQKAAMAG